VRVDPAHDLDALVDQQPPGQRHVVELEVGLVVGGDEHQVGLLGRRLDDGGELADPVARRGCGGRGRRDERGGRGDGDQGRPGGPATGAG
jgi:hypothetical protein